MTQPKATKAKCNLCGMIAISFVETDRASCLCGEISVIGGAIEMYKANSGNWKNISVIEDVSDTPSIESKDKQSTDVKDEVPNESHYSRSRQDRLYELKRLIESDINLPKHEHYEPVRRVDLVNYMVIILELLKLSEKSEKEGK